MNDPEENASFLKIYDQIIENFSDLQPPFFSDTDENKDSDDEKTNKHELSTVTTSLQQLKLNASPDQTNINVDLKNEENEKSE